MPCHAGTERRSGSGDGRGRGRIDCAHGGRRALSRRSTGGVDAGPLCRRRPRGGPPRRARRSCECSPGGRAHCPALGRHRPPHRGHSCHSRGLRTNSTVTAAHSSRGSGRDARTRGREVKGVPTGCSRVGNAAYHEGCGPPGRRASERARRPWKVSPAARRCQAGPGSTWARRSMSSWFEGPTAGRVLRVRCRRMRPRQVAVLRTRVRRVRRASPRPTDRLRGRSRCGNQRTGAAALRLRPRV